MITFRERSREWWGAVIAYSVPFGQRPSSFCAVAGGPLPKEGQSQNSSTVTGLGLECDSSEPSVRI